MVFSQTHSWTWSRLNCNQSTINNLGWYTDGGGAFTGEPNIACQPSAASCTGSLFTTINQRTYCTDYALSVQISTGSLITKVNIARTANIVVGFYSNAWAPEIPPTSGAFVGWWRVITRVDLTKNYPINSSPGKTSLFFESFLFHILKLLDLYLSFVLLKIKQQSFKYQLLIGIKQIIFVVVGLVVLELLEMNVMIFVIIFQMLIYHQG